MKNFQQDNLKDRVYDALVGMIKDDEFPDGKLPSEPKLSKDLGISRSTLRSVLTSMEKDGLLIRKHGIGTFINYGINRLNVNINNPTKVFQIIKNSGHKPSLLEEKVEIVKANILLQEKLKLADNEKLLSMERVFGADGKPAIYVEEYVPEKYLNDHLEELKDFPFSIYDIAKECTIEEISFTFTDIIPHIANDKLSKYLSCNEGDPILLMDEVHLNDRSHPVMSSKVYSSDKFIRFQMLKNNPK